MGSQPAALVIADDHALVRDGIRQFLDREDDLRVVGEAATGEEAIALCERLQPDVALLDLRLPGRSGIQVLERLRGPCPRTRFVILSAFDDEEYVAAALEAGAAGYLVKTAPAADLVAMVRRARDGEVVLTPSLASRIAARYRRPEPRLSPREREVLGLITKGLANKAIARRLGISERTVENHLRGIFDKLGVSSRTEAAVVAMQRRLVAAGEGL
jgi:DNA-binding NarL/FixJ family response regulator